MSAPEAPEATGTLDANGVWKPTLLHLLSLNTVDYSGKKKKNVSHVFYVCV